MFNSVIGVVSTRHKIPTGLKLYSIITANLFSVTDDKISIILYKYNYINKQNKMYSFLVIQQITIIFKIRFFFFNLPTFFF